jgi:hypothetical protein
MFSERENRSQLFKSLFPSFPPKAYTPESAKQNKLGKNALFSTMGDLSSNLLYLLKKVVRLEKLSSTSEPPIINMPRFLGKWQTEEKNKNL